jgi:hypothetical protein
MMLAEGIALALGGLASAYAIVGVAAFKTSYWRVVAVGGSVTFGYGPGAPRPFGPGARGRLGWCLPGAVGQVL